jgi:hypothetical protein
MKNSALKIEIIQKVIETDNIEILMDIYEMINSNNSSSQLNEPLEVYEKTEKVRYFTEWEQDKINKAVLQYENGECISDKEAQKEIQAWLED